MTEKADLQSVLDRAAEGGRITAEEASYGPGTPLLALATALVCAGLAAATGTRPELGVWLLLAPVGVLLAVVDFRVQRLPDLLTLPLAGRALVLLGRAALAARARGAAGRPRCSGALALGGRVLRALPHQPERHGLRRRETRARLGAVLGWYGWGTWCSAPSPGSCSARCTGRAGGRAARGRKTSIPFGPFLIAGAFVGLLIGAYAA